MYEGIVQDLIEELGRLPGVGPKSAQRIAFHMLNSDPVDVTRLAETMPGEAHGASARSAETSPEAEQCRICRDPRRELTVICAVEEPKDVVATSAPGNSVGATTYSVAPSARLTASGRTTSASRS